jgi:hypothetical protein
MRRAVLGSLLLTFVFYVGVGVTGYAALGDATPGNILTGFARPVGLVAAANAMVLVHMVPAYQVFSQPVFHMAEQALGARWGGLRERPLAMRLVLRSAYVIATTAVACAMPFFSGAHLGHAYAPGCVHLVQGCLDKLTLRAPQTPSHPFFTSPAFHPDIIGLIGAVVFWPSTVYYPIAMYAKVHSPPRWQRALMSFVNWLCFVVSVLAVVGSAANIARDAGSYQMFGGR